MPNASDKYKWCFVSGKIAALEQDFLSSAFLDNLAELYGSEALLRGLSETPYREHFQTLEDLQNAESILSEIWQRRFEDIRSVCPSQRIPDLFLLDAEFQNFKSYLKERYFDLPQTRQPTGRFTAEEYERLLEGLESPVSELFALGTARFQAEVERGQASPITVDWIFDAIYLGRHVEQGAATGSPIVADYTRTVAELKTAEIVLRAEGEDIHTDKLRSLFLANLPADLAALAESILEGEDETKLDALRGRLSEGQIRTITQEAERTSRCEALVREVRRRSFDLTGPARMVTFGPERVFAFLLELQNELSNLKLVIYGKLCFLESGLIRRRIVQPAAIPT